MATEVEWAWFTGLFEGEGCFAWSGKNSVYLTVTSTDRDVLERMRSIAGCGTLGKRTEPSRTRHPNWKESWYWQISRADQVEEIIDRMEPYLCSRRLERAQEARLRLAKVRRRGFCKQGHQLTADNLYKSRDGQAKCKACTLRRKYKNE